MTTHEFVEAVCNEAMALANTDRCQAEYSFESHDSPCVASASRTSHAQHYPETLPTPFGSCLLLTQQPRKLPGKVSDSSLQMDYSPIANLCHRDVKLNEGQDTANDEGYEECYRNWRSDRV